MFANTFTEPPTKEEWYWEKLRLTKYSYPTKDGAPPHYNLTVDGFTYIPLQVDQLEDLYVFLDTLKEDGIF